MLRDYYITDSKLFAISLRLYARLLQSLRYHISDIGEVFFYEDGVECRFFD